MIYMIVIVILMSTLTTLSQPVGSVTPQVKYVHPRSNGSVSCNVSEPCTLILINMQMIQSSISIPIPPLFSYPVTMNSTVASTCMAFKMSLFKVC